MGFQRFKFLGDLVVIQQYKKGNLGDEVTSISLKKLMTYAKFVSRVGDM